MLPPVRRVSYTCSTSLLDAADALPSNLGRASVVHNLIKSLDLLALKEDDATTSDPPPPGTLNASTLSQDLKATVVHAAPASREQLSSFHDAKFIDVLLGLESNASSSSDSDSNSDSDSDSDQPSPRKKQRRFESYGLEDDCPVFPELSSYVREVAGASVQAAREIRDGKAEVAIAWTGGRHHGKRGSSAGFCYINDITLAILELRKKPVSSRSSPSTLRRLRRILYIDLDLHHGDGVESSFLDTSEVLTISLHLHTPGFFPATGALDSTGTLSSPSSYHALNLALNPGLSSSSLLRMFESCVSPFATNEVFNPDAVVLQCGADGLAGDPCMEWNVDLTGMGKVVQQVMGWGLPTLLLGGGGYNNANTARMWASLTAIALGRDLNKDSHIPPEIDDYAMYAPAFTLDVPAGFMADKNTPETMENVEKTFVEYIEQVRRRTAANAL